MGMAANVNTAGSQSTQSCNAGQATFLTVR